LIYTLGHGTAVNLRASRRGIWAGSLIALAIAVELPAVIAPFATDDYDQAAMTTGEYPGHRGPFNLYDFIDDSNRAEMLERGIFPWFTSSKLFIRFLRPLPSALLSADHRLFGQNALLPHLHSLLWWAAACFAVFVLLRQCFSERVAFIGTGVFALSPCHSLPLVWLANREALVSSALGTLALAAYVRFREAPRLRAGLVAFGLFALALLAGEYSLGFTGYVLAIELVHPRESIARRVSAVACFAIPLAAYVAAHTLLGYGAFGAVFYRDPLHDLPNFVRGSPQRLSVLLLISWIGGGDLRWVWTPAWAPPIITMTCALLAAVPITRAFRALEVEKRRRAVWMLLGSLLSLFPALSVDPSVRLLAVSMVGVSAVVALVIERAWFPGVPDARRGASELTGLVALGFAFSHLVLAPLDTWLTNRHYARMTRMFNERATWVRDHAGQRDTIVALRTDSFLLSMPLIFRNRVRWRLLTLGSPRSLVLRTDDRAIEMISNPEPLMPESLQIKFRSELLQEGAVIDVPGMRAIVLQLDTDGAPHRIRFEFDRSLDDPSMFWVTEGATGFREQKPPSMGYAELVELVPEE
jgi:hypothetical protein